MGIGIRPTGVDNAAAALRYLERRQEVVANNLANVSTDGFKGERAFARLLADGSTPSLPQVDPVAIAHEHGLETMKAVAQFVKRKSYLPSGLPGRL